MNAPRSSSAAEAAPLGPKPTPFFSPRNVPLWMSRLAAALFVAIIAWPR